MARYLVTGGAGFIGSHLVEALVAHNHALTVIDVKPAPASLPPSVLWYQRSITKNLTDIFCRDAFDGVFHLAAIPSVQYSIEHPVETEAINYHGTQNLLAHCAEHHVPRFVFSSSAAIYGDHTTIPLLETLDPRPLSPYAQQKLCSEEACAFFKQHYNFTTVALRYFNVYGPGQSAASDYASVIPRFFERALQNKPLIIYGDGLQTRDFISVFDVVAANIAAMESRKLEFAGKVINVGSSRATTIKELAQQVGRIVGKNSAIVHEAPRVEPRQSCADITKAQELLAWQPQISLEKGLQKTHEYFKMKQDDVKD